MKLQRIFAIILRNLYSFRTNYDRMFDAFYWPIMELIVWGITSSYITKLSPNFSNILIVVVSGLTFWLIISRSQYEINVSLLEEVWSKNLINIFVSPIKFSEWIISILFIGAFKASISLVAAIFCAFILYKVNIFLFGFYLIPFIFLLLMTGWWTSFLITGLILRYGTKVQTFAWTLAYLLAPISAIYYPVSTLPEYIQKLSIFIPPMYVFQGIRNLIQEGKFDSSNLFISFILNFIYLIIALLFLRSSFYALLKKGMLQIH